MVNSVWKNYAFGEKNPGNLSTIYVWWPIDSSVLDLSLDPKYPLTHIMVYHFFRLDSHCYIEKTHTCDNNPFNPRYIIETLIKLQYSFRFLSILLKLLALSKTLQLKNYQHNLIKEIEYKILEWNNNKFFYESGYGG